jgi:hypothetical protein
MQEKENEALVSLLKQKRKIKEKIDNDKRGLKSVSDFNLRDFTLFHIEELTFEKDSPRKEALENVIGALDIDGINFVYLLVGEKHKVSFYLGVSKIQDKSLELDVDDIGEMILQPSIEGNFRGSKVTQLQKEQRKEILQKVQSYQRVARIDGVPSVNSESEEFQGIDRLVDVMFGDEFILMVLADPFTKDEIITIEDSLYDIHNKLSPMSKKSIQETEGSTTTVAKTETTNHSSTKGENQGESYTKTDGTSKGVTNSKGYTPSNGGNNSSNGSNEGSSKSKAQGQSSGSSSSETKGKSSSYNDSKAYNKGGSISREFIDKNISEWIEYIDEVLLPRVEYGKNKGLFHTAVYLLSDSKGSLLKLGNTMKSLFSGTENNKAPLEISYIGEKLVEKKSIKNLQFPSFTQSYEGNTAQLRLLFSKSRIAVGSWLSTNELSVVTSLPQKEVVGLTLKEEVEFGLNTKKVEIDNSNKLLLGSLVKSGQLLDVDISIDKKQLNKHIFIAGVTGSGKTTTCQRILDSAKYPFMVIEPAKTEYRILAQKRDDVMVFTLGDDSVAPFRINPFEIFQGENITSRVDMIKANIEAAFDMEAAIPQIIESALYECYEAYGWDIATSKNSRFEDPFANGVYSFPTLSDLIKQTAKVVEKQGFDERLKNDYMGSIRARLQGLLVGAKGLMLNTPRSIDFSDLIEKNVILELEEIKSGAEKSLLMGFVLINLNEALKQKHKKNKKFRHITLIEEAHRLLGKYTAGDNPSKKLGVETFADMLAEVRKYGESLVIVDQIPNKLTPEVLKNTNTKIVHKLFAKDDKEAIGNTMALEEEQKEFLSSLETGRVIVSNQDFVKPIQVQIKQLENVSTTEDDEIDESILREIALKYYQTNYKRGIIQGLELKEKMPTLEEIESYLSINLKGLTEGWSELFKAGNIKGEFKFEIKEYLEANKLVGKENMVAIYLMNRFYNTQKEYAIIHKYLVEFLKEVSSLDGRNKYNMKDQNILTIK